MLKIHTYEVYKIDIDRICQMNEKTIKIVPLTLTKEEAILNGELIRVQENQSIFAICNYIRETTGITDIDMSTIIVNVHVPTELRKKGEKMYMHLAEHGFYMNGNHYMRFASGSGQIRRNTIAFLRDDLIEPITNRLLCGLALSDFGNDFNAAKFNAYFGLNLSGCRLLPERLMPRVCIIDDYEAIRPHDIVNHVTEKEVDYITLSDEDYILSDDSDFEIVDGKAIRKSDGVAFKIRHGIKKDIQARHYDEIENSPCINSFDGQGLMCPEWAQQIADYLEYGYLPSQMIIRAPWTKGLLATIDFHSWFAEHGIAEITDSFGKVHKIADIDVIISKSQFKMHKVYVQKCQGLNVNPWDYLVENMQANNLRFGIVKPNKPDDYEKTLNYQYLEALDIDAKDTERLYKRTMDFLESLNSGDIKEVYRNLIANNTSSEYMDDTETNAPRYQLALNANPAMIDDKYIRNLILRECQTKLNAAKLGKIIVRGNYQFCVSDPIAQLEWIAKNHAGKDIDVVGVVPSGCIYSNYWSNANDNKGVITLLRSPLIDRNEIAKRKVIEKHEKYFDCLRSGLVISIHDLTALQCSGSDFDGDIYFSTNDSIIAKGSLNFDVAKPLYYELGSTGITGAIDINNMSQADVRGLNSAVGTISNRAAALYAMLVSHRKNSKAYKQIINQIIILGQIVGMEIDRIKTGVKPTFPLEWSHLQIEWQKGEITEPDIMVNPDEEAQGIYRHNAFVPDVKPYFLRYNYNYLDADISKLRYIANQNSVINFGMKLDELEKLCISGEATEDMQVLYNIYRKAYPVNDSACVVNRISRLFEQLQFDLQRKITSEGKNMLSNFVSTMALDADVLRQVEQVYKSYKRFLRMQAKKNSKSNDNNKSKVSNTANETEVMQNHCRKKLKEICGNSQQMFDYLVYVSKCDTKIVWDLMGDSILRQIKGE